MFLEDYKVEGEWVTSYRNIPMRYRYVPEVTNKLKQGFRVRYRGPRRKVTNPESRYFGQCSYSGQLTCLKEDATHFAIYPR